MLYSKCHITYLTTVRRTRTLPALGQVLRRIGDHVASDTLVAEADIPQGYRLIELSRALGRRVTDPQKVMVKKVGELVGEGEVIARVGWVFKSQCVSPVKGHILDARGDKVLIQVEPRHVTLNAFYPGQVVNVIPNLGVVIQVTGAVVQAAWGTGQDLRAGLESMVPDGDTALEAGQISAVHMGAILLGGRTVDRAALEQAIRSQVRGIIVGSLSSDLLPLIRASALSLIVTEGFGDIAMAAHTFSLLQSYAGREVCLCPPRHTRWETRRAEVLIPLPTRQEIEADGSTSLAPGTRVRALRAPYQGLQGEVVSLPPYRSQLESGILARGAVVDIASIGQVFVPLENLEIVR